MRLYHYAPFQNTILKKGIGTFAGGYGDVEPYIKRAKTDNRQEIISWMESVFKWRSRAISVITEPIKWSGNDPMLKAFVDNHVLFSFELDDLLKNDLIESVWCQNGQAPYPVRADEIEASPLPWAKCNRNKGLFFGVIRHYLIVLKSEVLPPEYLREEKKL